MDRLLERLSTTISSSNQGFGSEFGSERGNAIATSGSGLSAILCSDRIILFTTNGPSNARNQVLYFPQVYVSEFSSVEFNGKGTSLLLWNTRTAAVVDVHEFQTLCRRDTKAVVPLQFIGQRYMADGSATLAKARWHPIDPFCVVLLFGSSVMPLVLVDVTSNYNNDSSSSGAGSSVITSSDGGCEEYSLNEQLSDDFVSFTFGPNTPGSRFTIFILTERGLVFTLAPVIPARVRRGAMYSRLLDEMYAGSGEAPPSVPVENGTEDVPPLLASMRGPHFRSISTDANGTDLCFPLLATTGKLVLALVRTSGVVDLLCLAEESGVIAQESPDQFIHAERVFLAGGMDQEGPSEAMAGEGGHWMLVPDSAMGHVLHASCLGQGKHVVVNLCWLKALVASGNTGGMNADDSMEHQRNADMDGDPILDNPSSCSPVLAESEAFSGVAVVCSSLVGHWAIYLTGCYGVQAVNISIISRMASSRVDPSSIKASEASRRELPAITDASFNNLHELLHAAEVAMNDMVLPEVPDKKYKVESDSWLMEAVSVLEKEVLLKLELVQAAIRKKVDGLKRSTRRCKDLITFHKNETASLRARWRDQGREWAERVAAARAAQLNLRERVVRVLMDVVKLNGGTNRLSKAEEGYRRDLTVWESTRQTLHRLLQELQRKQQQQMMMVETSGRSPMRASAGGAATAAAGTRTSLDLPRSTSGTSLSSPHVPKGGSTSRLPNSPSLSPVGVKRSPMQPRSSLLQRRSVAGLSALSAGREGLSPLQASPAKGIQKGQTVGLRLSMQPRSGRSSSVTYPSSVYRRMSTATSPTPSPTLRADPMRRGTYSMSASPMRSPGPSVVAAAAAASALPPPPPPSASPMRPEAMEVCTASMDAMRSMMDKSTAELASLRRVLDELRSDMQRKMPMGTE